MMRRAVAGGVARGRRRNAGVAVAMALAAFFACAGPAAADEQPSILKAYGLDWIERVRDDAWPQPKAQRPVICLLDTGVAITPDTPADDPAGPIVARLAIDGGDGLPQGNTFEHLHGTTMASVIAAPRNDYGTVGVFPQARIVSVRVTVGDATYITPSAMRFGSDLCGEWSLASGVKVAAVVMAESNYDQRESDTSSWETAAQRARLNGGVFVAAAGNSAGANALAPSAARGVVTVAAGSERGAPCEFAPVPPARALMGPGCSSEVRGGLPAWPAGSSSATAAAGGLLAAIATARPASDPDERLSFIQDSSTAALGMHNLSGSGARSSLFAGFVNEDPPAMPVAAVGAANAQLVGPPLPATAASSSPQLESAVAQRQLLWRPDLTASWRRGLLRVAVRGDRSHRGRLVVRVGRGSTLTVGKNKARIVSVHIASRPRTVVGWIEGTGTSRWRSLARTVRVSSR